MLLAGVLAAHRFTFMVPLDSAAFARPQKFALKGVGSNPNWRLANPHGPDPSSILTTTLWQPSILENDINGFYIVFTTEKERERESIRSNNKRKSRLILLQYGSILTAPAPANSNKYSTSIHSNFAVFVGPPLKKNI